MNISSWQKESLIDYPGKCATVIFVSGCNYNCPYCHNPQLKKAEKGKISEDEILDYIDSRKGWIDGIVISGGEPTLQHTLPFFLEKIKKRNLAVKLDTNGSNYKALGDLLEKKLVDFVAMDVKSPFRLYTNATGKGNIDERDDVGKAMLIVSSFPDYEFRTTLAPVERENGEISFMTPEEMEETAKFIYDWTGYRGNKYSLQPFVPRKDGLMDKRFEEFPETPKKLLEEAKKKAKQYLPKCEIKG